MPRPRLTDPVLIFLLQELRKANEKLPASERIGFRVYCKRYGILAPEHWESIERFEVEMPGESIDYVEGGDSE